MKMKALIPLSLAALLGAAAAQTQVGQVTLTPVTPRTSTGGVKPRPVAPAPVSPKAQPVQSSATSTSVKATQSFELQQAPAGWYNLTGQVTGTASLPKGAQVVLTLEDLQKPNTSLLQIKFGASRLPVPYQMYFNQGKLQNGKTYGVRAKVFDAGGKLLYTSSAVALPKTSPSALNIPVR